MPTDLVVHQPRPYELTEKQVTIIANTEFVPKEKRGKYDVIWASIFHGRSLGIDDMSAIQKIHIINGTPALAATLASGIATQRGHKIEGDMSATSATARGTRGDNGAQMSVTFTMEDAKAAGLAGKQVYKQHPQSMLWARAVTQLCRALFPDCFIGGVYTPEELGADFVAEGDIIEHDPPSTLEATVANLRSNGGLTEPGVSEAGDVPPVAPPSGVAAPGSVSSLDMLIATYGREPVAHAYRELFPGRGNAQLTDEEVEVLADRLTSETVEA